MLQIIRDKAQGWIAGIIVALICIPFALWGIHSYIDAAHKVVVAKVNGDDIDLQRFQDALQQFRQRIEQSGNAKLAELAGREGALKQEALSALIREKLIEQFGADNLLFISDDQVAAFIHSMEEFKRDGTFSKELYEQRIGASGMRPLAFEQRLRHDMLREQLRQGVGESSFATRRDVETYARLFEQTRTFDYALVPAAKFRNPAAITDQQVSQHYEQNRDQYMTDEQVKLDYIELSVESLMPKVTVTDADLDGYFEANKANYTLPDQRRGEYLLVPLPKGAHPEEVAAAEKLANSFLTQLRAGRPFDKLEGIPPVEEGKPRVEIGESGFVQKGMLPEPLDGALFSLQLNELSGLLRSDSGLQVIRLLEVKPGGLRDFASVRPDVESAFRREQAEREFFALAEDLQNTAFEKSDSLKPAADAVGLEVRTSDFLTRKGGAGVLGEKKVLDVAFNPDFLRDGVNSEPIDLGKNHIVVLHAREHRPPVERPIGEVRAQIVDTLIAVAARADAAREGARVLDSLRAGAARETVSAADALEWKTADKVARSDTTVSRAVTRAAFRLGRPAADNALYGGLSTASGDYAIIALRSVQDGDPTKVKKEDLDNARSQLTSLYGAQAWQDFQDELEAGASITRYSEHIDKI